MHYLTAAEILVIHDRLIHTIGGSLGLRDENLLRSLAERPKASFGGQKQFPTIFLKAAAYMEGIATYHVFVDGNKRTALTATYVFLGSNGYHVPELPITETEEFLLAVVQRQKSVQEIATWIGQRSKKA